MGGQLMQEKQGVRRRLDCSAEADGRERLAEQSGSCVQEGWQWVTGLKHLPFARWRGWDTHPGPVLLTTSPSVPHKLAG